MPGFGSALKREPFFRALRCDKLILSALQTTVDHYLAGDGQSAIPVLAMLNASNAELLERAKKIIAALASDQRGLKASLGEGKAQLGGGTMPRSVIPSVTIDLALANVPLADLAARLRHGTPPVIGYVSGGWFKLDLRTIFPRQDEELIRALTRLALIPATRDS